jgi:membrane fusion protein (multidrug efflux system)
MNSQTDHRSDEKLGGAGEVAIGVTRAKPNGKRKKLLMAVFGVLVVLGSVYGAYWWIVARYTESTDNAYVGGNVVQITPQVEGTVVAIGVDDADYVQAGQPLVQLDRTDAAVALKKAEAQLAQTIRETRGLYADTARLQAAVAERQVDADKARDDLVRREKLVKSNYVSDEDLQHSRDAARTSEAALQVVQEQLAANRALTDATCGGYASQCRARHGGVTRSLAHLSA